MNAVVDLIIAGLIKAILLSVGVLILIVVIGLIITLLRGGCE